MQSTAATVEEYISQLPKGIYVVKLTGSKIVQVNKLVIQ